jgi:hypothetical protein
MRARRTYPIVAADVRTLGGVVTVAPSRDRVDGGEAFFQITHVSRGRDVVWTSSRIDGEDRADAAARALAEFVGGEVRR